MDKLYPCPDEKKCKRASWLSGIKVVLIIGLCFVSGFSQAQPYCNGGVPTFVVNLTGNPNGSWISPPVTRVDQCCGVTPPDKCVQFIITLDPNSNGLVFDIYSGAVPPGALFYQINCGPPTPVGAPICLSGVGPHYLTFCKPGNNNNEYSITAIGAPMAGPGTTINDGCSATLTASGFNESTVTWTSVFPGAPGAYNSLLSCTTGCDTINVTASGLLPSYIDYMICGQPTGNCGPSDCDTVRVYFNPTLAVQINPSQPVVCFGNTTTTVTAMPTGGTGPYSYLWSTGATTQTTNLGPGTFFVTLSDATNCPPVTASVTVTSFTAAITANAGGDINICNNQFPVQLNGSVTGVTTGQWSGGSGTYSPSNTTLNATYMPTAAEIASGSVILTLTTTNNLGCPAGTDQVTLYFNQFNPNSITITQTHVSCYGLTNGSATANATGANGPFYYSWNTIPIQTGPTASGLAPGTYSVTVTDAYGCTAVSGISITQPAALSSTGSQTNIQCNSVCSGSASVLVSGGTGPYSYSWTPSGGSSASASTLCAGSYTCTITDANGCTTTRSFTITQPPSITATTSQTNLLCNSVCNGAASVSVSGGVTPYTYSWLPSGSTSATATSLCATNYTCTVTDANGCTTTRTFAITEPPALSSTSSQTNILCFGQCNGSASVSPTGGTTPYSYSWVPSGGSGPQAASRCAGSYTCTVIDANGCTTSNTFNITQPPALAVTGSQTNILCNGSCSGSASVSPTGGTAPYSYSWSPSGGFNVSANALCAGLYTCTITDASGCSVTQTFNITQPPAMATNGSQTNLLCNGVCNGAASVSVSGGATPYTYLWFPSGNTSATATALCAGNYTCSITDANGCTTSRTFAITEPSALASSGTQTNILCFGQCNGSASVTATGGTTPYSYSWLPSGGISPLTTSRCAGNYTCTVVDANGCSTTSTFAITAPPALAATGSQTNILCNGACTGSASVNPSGGTAPYTFSWLPSGGTNSTAFSLCAGTYTCTTTDANGCSITNTFNITQPPALAVSGTQTNLLCNGVCNGSASVLPSGGTSPYSYAWSPSGGFNATANGLCAGTYTCTVTDANGCTITRSFTIVQPASLTSTGTQTNILCYGACNGSAAVSPVGGTAPYAYAWSPSGGVSATAPSLCAGNYTCIITDAGGCSATNTFSITQPPQLTTTFGQTNLSCNASCDGSAWVTPSGGNPPYTYLWAPSGGNGNTAGNLCAGNYNCTITDANGCTISQTFTLTQPAMLATTGAQANLLCNSVCNGSASVTTTGGTPTYSYFWQPSGNTNAAINSLCAGTYTCTVTDLNGCTITRSFTITQPATLTATGTQTNVACNTSCTGVASVTPTGGTTPYSYSWQPSGGTGAVAGSLCAGTYTCNILDANGCATSVTFQIQQPTNLVATTTQTNILCNGVCTGAANVTVSSGTFPYTYSWNPPVGSSPSVNSLCVGTYTCNVTDANGCTVSASFQITEPPALTATSSQTNLTCNGVCAGVASVTPAGGTPPYYYTWAPVGGTGPVANSLCAGTYTCTIMDANNCTITRTFLITEPVAITSTGTSSNLWCNSVCNGSATISPSGGTLPYSYNWLPSGGGSPTANSLCAGTYTCTVTDVNGCTTSNSYIITQPPALTATSSQTNVTCAGSCNGSAVITPAGGTQPYTYSWLPSGGTNASAINLCPGTYTCITSDANGCSLSTTFNITEPPALATSGTQTNVPCNGICVGSASVTVTGGSPFYNYQWAPSGGNGPFTNGLCSGMYICTVTDANGCTVQQSFNITQLSPINVSAASIPATCDNVCDGQLIAVPSGGMQPYNILWSSGCNAVSCAGVCAGTYSVVLTDANGCTAADTVAVSEPAPIVITTTSTDAHCNQADGSISTSVTGGTPAYNYLWSPNNQVTPSASGLTPGLYTLLVTDAQGCTASVNAFVNSQSGVIASVTNIVQPSCPGNCDGSAVGVATSGTGPYFYVWSNNSTGDTVNNLCASSTPYMLTVTDIYGCSDTTYFFMQDPAPVTVVSTPSVVICSGQTVTLTATANGGNPGYTFNWSSGSSTVTPPVTSVYSVTATDTNGCSSGQALVTVFVGPQLAITTNTVAPTCANSIVTLSANASGGNGGPYSYTWQPGNITGPSVNVSATSTTVYTVTVTDFCTTPTATGTVVVSILGFPDASFASDTSACTGSCVQFYNTTINGASYEWDFGDGNTSTTASPVNCYTEPGEYDVTLVVTDNNGCRDSMTLPAYMTVHPSPVAQFTYGPQPTTLLNPEICFNDQSSADVVSWYWDFDDPSDGTGSNAQHPCHSYSDTGRFCAELTVYNQYGCASTTENCLDIEPYFSIYVPNAFTPDHDGLNDVFYPVITNAVEQDYLFQIFDRWGNLIFETTSLYQPWDGRAKGGDQLAQIDTYIWKIMVNDNMGQTHKLIGHVSLIK